MSPFVGKGYTEVSVSEMRGVTTSRERIGRLAPKGSRCCSGGTRSSFFFALERDKLDDGPDIPRRYPMPFATCTQHRGLLEQCTGAQPEIALTQSKS